MPQLGRLELYRLAISAYVGNPTAAGADAAVVLQRLLLHFALPFRCGSMQGLVLSAGKHQTSANPTWAA